MYYNSLNNFLKEKFGSKVYKIALDGGFTCPNRDGKIGSNGCIFCSKGGSGEFASSRDDSITEQLKKAKERIANKCHSHKYIAYFQAFTNTYAPLDYLRKVYYEAISDKEVVALSIGTRPDCLDLPVVELLEEINNRTPVFVELGLQTIKKESIEYIRRGYENDIYIEKANLLREKGINVVTHIIIGLPNESKSDILNSVRFAGKYSDGVKLQLLHILKDTDLYRDYINGDFETLSVDDYVDILCDAIEVLPKNVVIHRLTGDGDKKLLVSPMWSANKKFVLNYINKTFSERNISQGKRYND